MCFSVHLPGGSDIPPLDIPNHKHAFASSIRKGIPVTGKPIHTQCLVMRNLYLVASDEIQRSIYDLSVELEGGSPRRSPGGKGKRQ